MVTRGDYPPDAVEACKAVLIELVHMMGEFRDHMVVVRGWVPGLLFPEAPEPHVGTLDIDLALNFAKIADESYRTILHALQARGYRQDPRQPFRFFRDVPMQGGRSMVVEVDLLAGEYGGTGPGHRTQPVQDARARKARGCDLVFADTVSVTVDGEFPEGGRDRVGFSVAGIVPFLVMKGMALADRLKEKDAYDIIYCVRHYPGGSLRLAEVFRPHLTHGLVREGLGKIRRQFLSVEHAGPRWVADFQETRDPEERAIEQRRAFELVTAWLDALGIEPWSGD